ncbi:hypothetical protein BDW74DRAFT_146228 [Aspergillus multicolor]|uniref:uncharacterized protein n=1 Tax=Aspergillus multicolor TaxID=41759 RepID=UPI003CCE44BE
MSPTGSRPMMHSNGRKRRVTTCVPCYKRKQKCNRQHPCNHCTRRRRPEECLYSSSSAEPGPRADKAQDRLLGAAQSERSRVDESSSFALGETHGRSFSPRSALAQSFGYFEDSSCNTMALLRRVRSSFFEVAVDTAGMS